MDKLKLQWKIFGFLLGFCGLLLIILWLFQTVLISDTYKMVRKSEIHQAIDLVEENINSPDLENILLDLEQNKEIMVTNTNNFAQSQLPQKNGIKSGSRNGFGNGWGASKGRNPAENLTQDHQFMLADGSKISLTFHAMITPVNATISTLEVQFHVITIIMILLSVVLAFLIARRVAKPIVDINTSAKELAKSNYDVKFNGHGFLEIAELSDTLNTASTELAKVETLRRELMANISHDLRTPLALIYSYAELMHDFPNEINPEQTQVIMDETTRLTSLVNDVLDISKLEAGNLTLNLHPYNLTESIAATVARVSELVKKDGYQLNFNYQEQAETIADEVKITQAFYNLLLNAITHTGKNKTININQAIVGGKVTITVSDTGEGIAAENIPYIWDRYYKVDKTHKRAVTGTGLGLSIVKKIILLHHGKCGVESQPGKGSDFWFSLELNKKINPQHF